MATFTYTIRVELHDANWQDYARLHSNMEAAGYRRFVVADDGTKYQLPTAEYDLTTTLNIEQVRDAAGQIARQSHPSSPHWVLVTQSTARAWTLKPI